VDNDQTKKITDLKQKSTYPPGASALRPAASCSL